MTEPSVVQIRDYERKPGKHLVRKVNQSADRAFWMGHTTGDGSGTMLTGPSVRTEYFEVERIKRIVPKSES